MKGTESSTIGMVRPVVSDLLASSRAFATLRPEAQREIARDMVKVAAYIVGDETPGAPPHRVRFERFDEGGAVTRSAVVEEVDFPQFVADLIEATFHAIVQASIEQMEAYGELVANVAKTVDEFVAEDRAEQRRARSRQQLVATMVLMGINRIVVTDGKIQARVVFELEDDGSSDEEACRA